MLSQHATTAPTALPFLVHQNQLRKLLKTSKKMVSSQRQLNPPAMLSTANTLPMLVQNCANHWNESFQRQRIVHHVGSVQAFQNQTGQHQLPNKVQPLTMSTICCRRFCSTKPFRKSRKMRFALKLHRPAYCKPF